MLKPNAQMQQILDAHKDMGPLPIESLPPELARQIPLLDRGAVAVYGHHITKKALAPFPMTVGSVENIAIQGDEQNDIIVRVYKPTGKAPDGGWPVLTYIHGGGWVIATLDTYDASCRALCLQAECIVVSVHYRQAPEHKFPAAKHDVYNAWQWVCDNAANLGGNPHKIAVAGESAGGNLATVLCLLIRDKGGAMMPIHQLLVYPVTDLLDGMNSPSAMENANAKPLNRPMLSWFYNHYLEAGEDRSNPYISPLHAEDLSGLPPATIILAEIDPLRSEGEAYATKLRNAGVHTQLQVYDSVTHEFFGLVGLVSEATDAVSFAAEQLKMAFGHETADIPRRTASR